MPVTPALHANASANVFLWDLSEHVTPPFNPTFTPVPSNDEVLALLGPTYNLVLPDAPKSPRSLVESSSRSTHALHTWAPSNEPFHDTHFQSESEGPWDDSSSSGLTPESNETSPFSILSSRHASPNSCRPSTPLLQVDLSRSQHDEFLQGQGMGYQHTVLQDLSGPSHISSIPLGEHHSFGATSQQSSSSAHFLLPQRSAWNAHPAQVAEFMHRNVSEPFNFGFPTTYGTSVFATDQLTKPIETVESFVELESAVTSGPATQKRRRILTAATREKAKQVRRKKPCVRCRMYKIGVGIVIFVH